MPTDAVTAQLGIPKPDPANDVDYDFTRIILAMEMIDGFIHALQTALAGVAPSDHTHVIDDVDGLQAALNSLADSIANVSGTLAGLEDTDVSDATQGMLLQYLNEKWVSVAAKAAFFAIDPINGLSANNVQAALAELVQEVTTPTVDPAFQSYVFDGETDTVTLPATPNSKNAVFLNLNGNFVLHEDFALNDADVTFNTMPAAGHKLNAMVLTAVEIGEPSPETVDADKIKTSGIPELLVKLGISPVTGDPDHLINGSFDIYQEGQGPFDLTSGYVCDMWRMFRVAGTSCPITIEDRPLGSRTRKRLKWERPTPGANPAALFQPIEFVDTLGGQTCTFTFRAQASAPTELQVNISQFFGTGGAPSATNETAFQTVNLTTEETEFSLLFTLDSVEGKVIGTGLNDALRAAFTRQHDSTNPTATVYISEVSLLSGDMRASEIKRPRRSRGQELHMAHYYFYKSQIPFSSDHQSKITGTFPRWMRATPGIAFTLFGGVTVNGGQSVRPDGFHLYGLSGPTFTQSLTADARL